MDDSASNSYVFENLIKGSVESFLKGINATVMMYGPTGSGKTYTMIGDERTRNSLRQINSSEIPFDPSTKHSEPGILFLALNYIFKTLEKDLKTTSSLKVSYVEIYNDNTYDLLQGKTALSIPLQINEDDQGKFLIKGVIEQSAKSVEEIMQIIIQGEGNRHYAESVMNHNSSRSHTVFQLKLEKKEINNTTKSEIVFNS